MHWHSPMAYPIGDRNSNRTDWRNWLAPFRWADLPMITICALCEGLHATAKGTHWAYWLCAYAPIEAQLNPVTGEMTEPFKRCRYINDGACELFRAGPNILHPRSIDQSLVAISTS